jgi:hypothetical protein
MVKQSGILYYFLEGFLLIIGALCYTVSTRPLSLRIIEWSVIFYRCGYRKPLSQVDLIFSDPPIKYFMYL